MQQFYLFLLYVNDRDGSYLHKERERYLQFLSIFPILYVKCVISRVMRGSMILFLLFLDLSIFHILTYLKASNELVSLGLTKNWKDIFTQKTCVFVMQRMDKKLVRETEFESWPIHALRPWSLLVDWLYDKHVIRFIGI